MVDIGILEKLGEIFAAMLDADSAIAQFLALARSVGGSPYGAVFLRDERRNVFRRWRESDEHPLLDLPLPMVEADFANKTHRYVAMGEQRLDGVDAVRAAREQTPITHTLALAMRHQGVLLGLLSLGFTGPTELPEPTIRTLLAIATFPAAALEHARTRALGERRARLGLLLRRFGEQAVALTGVPQLHRLILDTVVGLTGADQASVTQVEGALVRVLDGVGKDAQFVGTTAPVEMMREALTSSEPFIIQDIDGADPKALLTKLARKTGAGSFVALPMRHQERTFGHLFAGCAQPRAFGAEEIEGMRILASMAAALLEQRSAQAAAVREARRLAATIEDLPIFVEVYGADGARLQANAAARALRRQLGVAEGSAADPFPGCRVQALDGLELARAELPSARALGGERAAPCEMIIAGGDGGRLATLLMAAAPMQVRAGGEVDAVVVGCQDVSRLHELAEAKDRFLRIASHELRTPITALRATTQLLELQPEVAGDDARRVALLQRLDRQSTRLTRLVEQLLDSARLDAGAVPLARAPVDLVALCRGVLESTMPAGGPRARLQSAEAVIIGRVDPLRIEQVVTNLLSNAARYSPADSEVVLTITRDGGRAQIAVSDRGIGIPAPQLEQLFAPFFRGSNAQTRFPGGLGLGLHIAQEIVRRHGGDIRVQSRENEGSTFVVELPLD